MFFLFYSLIGVCSKAAAAHNFLSIEFCLFYGAELFLLFLYAIVWQQIIKRMPLSVAFSNKGVTILWAMLWGKLFFGEPITINKLIGVFLVIAGIILFANAGDSHE